MSVLTNTTMKNVSDALGAADAYYQATLGLGSLTGNPPNYASVPMAGTAGATAADGLRYSRLTIDQTQTETDVDNTLVLVNALRAVEKTLPTSMGSALTGAVAALNTFFVNQTTSNFRIYWDAKSAGRTVAWTDAFRALWRRARNEELIVRVGSISRGAGSWNAYAADKTITIASKLELRTSSLIGATPITVNATLTKTGGTDLVVVEIPAGTPSGTVFSLGSTGYTAASLSCTGGTNADAIEVWVAQ